MTLTAECERQQGFMNLTDDDRYQILIDVATQYIDEQSHPEDNQFKVSYTINISNIGTFNCTTAQPGIGSLLMPTTRYRRLKARAL